MQDVATRAGVSRTTVSFVINDTELATAIPEETRARVWEAVRALEYRPNQVARNLRTQRTNVIGFLTDEVASTPFAGHLIAGAQAAAWAAGRILMIINTERNEALTATAVEMLLDRQVDGMIYATMYHREVTPPTAIRAVPTVLLDCFVADRSLPSVVPDELRGGREATEVLCAQGHRRVAFINLNRPALLPAAALRFAGYQQALAAYGIAFDGALVRDGDGGPPSGYRHTLDLMQQPDPPTAIFCGTDRMAMGAYDALRELGQAIPGDVAVMGFDDQDMIATYLRPALSTMALPHRAMGEWAVRALIEHGARSDGLEPVQQLLPCPRITRSSV